MGTVDDKSDDEYSVIGDKGDIGFIDFEKYKSSGSYDPTGESEIVEISVPFPLVNGRPVSGVVGETIANPITIKNTSENLLELYSIKIYDSKPEDSFTLSLMEPPTESSDAEYIEEFIESFSVDNRSLRPEQTLIVWLSCKPKEIGLHTSAVHINAGDESIERLVFVLAEDKVCRSLVSNRPYNRARKKKVDIFTGDAAFIVGSRPSRPSNRGFKHRLPEYPIPREIVELVERKQMPDAIMQGLRKENYFTYFRTLLVMEEIKMKQDMREYDMECVTMKHRGRQFLSLEVPGLAERRPSLVYGDCIFAQPAYQDASGTKPYQGYIHRVEAEEVFLKFDKDFHARHREDNVYNVQFAYNRVGMRRMIQAIEAANSLTKEVLFPSELSGRRHIRTTPLEPISCMLNEEQMGAVEKILGCRGGPAYVIHGPPGTGKTKTLIEAILQLYTGRNNARILVCAPSNSAADDILEKLLNEQAVEFQPHDIFRLNAITRPFDDVCPDHLGFCSFEDETFKCPLLRDLIRYRIIISTYASAYLLYAEGIKRGHFSHIFLDEAAQASEPETMIPLAHLLRMETVFVLAGDHLQLGPVVFSEQAQSCGLGKSFMERIYDGRMYGNEHYITKLVRNYRCHPAILNLPSEMFYGGELISCKEDDGRTVVDLLPNKEFPLLFIGVQGYDEREGSNPSWFNRIEASKVVEIVRNLVEDNGVREEDIGVITPYRQQVLKIRNVLESFYWNGIKVGSVEQFQGQEREVIIISTVRSTVKHNEFDKIHYLGFLSNPRRFNVAITRARSLLIVIGNPHIICQDPQWNKLLWYCVDNGSYTGCFLPERQENVDYESVGGRNEETNDQFFDGGRDTEPNETNDQFFDGGRDTECIEHKHKADVWEDLPPPVTDENEWSDGWK